jgi:D-alanyl-D-alanine carboxypeptidase/D-alanyl-D-alanine-endopeptidase (penicillin-binding protein 4)
MLRRKRFLLPALLLTCAAAAAADTLEQTIAALLERPAAQRAVWGVQAVDLASGAVVYQLNSEQLFTPASSAKLFATALGLERLGADHQFTTRVVADSPLGADGKLDGDLRLLGGGDPSLSARVVPYDKRLEFRADRLEPIRELARQIAQAGVKIVAGDIIGDDTRYVWDPYPPGWSIEDSTWGYGAPVSALSLNDNFIRVLVRPGAAAGAPARLRIDPDLDYYNIRNLTRTASTRTVPQGLGLRLKPGVRGIDLWGQISIRSPGRDMEVAVDDPALFSAVALKKALEDAGIEVTGKPRAEHAEPHQFASLKSAPSSDEKEYAAAFAAIVSPRLGEELKLTNKMSLNLHAEMLLREVGFARRNVGSVQAGIEEMRAFLGEAGLTPWEFFLADGSGLSRQNLVSPAGAVKLLRFMARSPQAQAYLDSLPVAGQDGTLDWRFSRSAAKGKIRAKTGTLSHVTALAGYAETVDGRNLAFAVFVNNFGVSTSYMRGIVDQIAIALVTTPQEIPGS